VDALRAGDEQRFTALVRGWSGPMLQLAIARVGSRAVAEEVVQESWLMVLRDVDRFEGRSALRTWVLGIVCKCRTCARESRAARLARRRHRGDRRSHAVSRLRRRVA
jgi:RNA polymerase sigma-70 factor (ECF subfamily)